MTTTTTKRRAKRAPPPPLPADELDRRLQEIRKLVTSAERKAARIAADQEINRSTRARMQLKARAEAVDQIAQVLCR